MCVMCACINRDAEAAPVLMNMGKRIEGLWSGYYTGLGCIGDDGVIRAAKTTGYSRYWEAQFDVRDFPGKCGFFHSRTGSGGDRRFAHPFVSHDGSCMLVSQGCSGIFSHENEKITAIANMLFEKGVRFSSADFETPKKKYVILKDGSQVHVSDIVCEYGAYLLKQNGNPLETLRTTGNSIREEAVSMFIFRDFPGHIYISNMNQRIFVSFDEDGAKLCSCALALGNRRKNGVELLPNSVSDVTADGIRMETLSHDLHPYGFIPSNLEAAFIAWMKKNPQTRLADVFDYALKGHYLPEILRSLPIYEIFEKLYYDGVVRVKREFDRPGMDENDSVMDWIVYSASC